MFKHYYHSKGWCWARYCFNSFALLVLVFLITPVLVIIPLSFNGSSFLTYPLDGISLQWYKTFFTSEAWLGALQNSLIIAPIATLLATALGTLAAMGITRSNFRGRMLFMTIIMSPMVTPIVIVAVGIYFFFAQLNLTNSYLGLILAHTVLGLPFVVITVSATLRGYNIYYSNGAASLGASPFMVFRTVTFPLIAPGVISGALFAFATSCDEIVVTLFLASPKQHTLPMQMFSGIRENVEPTIAAAATIMLISSAGLLLTIEWIRRRNEKIRIKSNF